MGVQKKVILLFTLLYCVSCNLNIKNEDFRTRAGLKSFKDKIENGDTVTIVYFGGSITHAKGWRYESENWFKERYQDVNFKFINAGIPGTSSFFGAFRTNKDVLRYDPDLVFIEFAVNDLTIEDEIILKSFDGIVSKIFKSNVDTDICFIYTLEQSKLDSTSENSLFRSVRTMEKVADYYQIRSINFGTIVSKKVNDNSLIFKGDSCYQGQIPVFSSDGVHPYIETGHKIYADIFQDRIKKVLLNSKVNDKKLKQPFVQGNLENANMVALTKDQFKGSWSLLKDSIILAAIDDSSNTYYLGESGSSITFKYKGNYLGVADIIGPQAGGIEVYLEGELADTIVRFDPYSTFFRKHFFIKKLETDSLVTVQLQFAELPLNKRDILNKKSAYDKDSLSYLKYRWMPSHLLFDGEIE